MRYVWVFSGHCCWRLCLRGYSWANQRLVSVQTHATRTAGMPEDHFMLWWSCLRWCWWLKNGCSAWRHFMQVSAIECCGCHNHSVLLYNTFTWARKAWTSVHWSMCIDNYRVSFSYVPSTCHPPCPLHPPASQVRITRTVQCSNFCAVDNLYLAQASFDLSWILQLR